VSRREAKVLEEEISIYFEVNILKKRDISELIDLSALMSTNCAHALKWYL